VSTGLTTIGFDADDTLWHNEHFFRLTEARFAELLADWCEKDNLVERLLDAERRNLALYGYGIKGFILSMIETAVEVSDGRAPSSVLGAILEAGREMLSHPVDALPHVNETLEALSGDFRLVLITKGDFFDQERKIAESGLAERFDAIEIVHEKTTGTYETLFARHGDGAARAAMVGNSLKSDILPALQAGSHAVHVPYEITWELERAEEPDGHERFHRLPDLSGLPALLARLRDGATS